MPDKVIWGVLLALVAGCDERERLVFDTDPEDQVGPTTSILQPGTDTTITEGDAFVMGARSVDPSGVDSIYIEVTGANLSYLPFEGEGRDTLNLAINLPTIGFFGRTITIGVHGVDVIGNVGPTVTRRITIQ